MQVNALEAYQASVQDEEARGNRNELPADEDPEYYDPETDPDPDPDTYADTHAQYDHDPYFDQVLYGNGDQGEHPDHDY
jgi:hypothetical protein